jgi:hypothetical protein
MEDTENSDIKTTEDSSPVENQLSDEELEKAVGGEMACWPVGGGYSLCKEV